VRDYIHVVDLCSAHLLTLERLVSGSGSKRYNLGNGEGFSVCEVIDAVIKHTGKEFKVIKENRRMGDPATLVANSALAQAELGWTPEYTDLSQIVEHAWKWETNHFMIS
jgi:UDP-glucose 4-epimerase